MRITINLSICSVSHLLQAGRLTLFLVKFLLFFHIKRIYTSDSQANIHAFIARNGSMFFIKHRTPENNAQARGKTKKVNGYRLFSFIRSFACSFNCEYVESGLIGSNRLNSGYGHREVEHALHDAARRQVYHAVRRVCSDQCSHPHR